MNTFVVVVGLFNLVLLVVQLILLGVNVATRRISPAAADQTLQERLEATQRDREVMSQLERAYQDQTQMVKTIIGLFGEGLKFLSPITPFKSDDELRKFILDVTVPGKPSVSEIDDEILVPTPDEENPHSELAPFTVINLNPGLGGEPTVIDQQTDDKRTAAFPAGYNILMQSQPPAWVHHKDTGYELSMEWIVGEVGFTIPEVMLYPDNKYLLKLVADTQITGEALNNFAVGAAGAYGRHEGNYLTQLWEHPLETGLKEYIWTIIPTKAGKHTLDVWVKSRFGEPGGKVYVKKIHVETLPDDWTGKGRVI